MIGLPLGLAERKLRSSGVAYVASDPYLFLMHDTCWECCYAHCLRSSNALHFLAGPIPPSIPL